jgi:hypothetical protein
VRIRILPAGNGGYLFVDLLVGLTILSITLVGLYTGARQLTESRRRVMEKYYGSLSQYETEVLEKPEQ